MKKLVSYGKVLKSVACVPFILKAADEIQITIFFFISFGAKKTKRVITSN